MQHYGRIVSDRSLTRRFLSLGPVDKTVILLSACLFSMLIVDPLVLGVTRGLDEEVRAFFGAITDIGKSGWILVVTGLGCAASAALYRRSERLRLRAAYAYLGQLAAFVFLAVATTGLAASLSKNIIGRARPKFHDTLGAFDFSPFAFRADLAAFPSGHATTVFALATALALLWPRARIVLFTAAVWAASSRFMIAAHYFTDVVAGAALGTGGTLMLRQALARRRWLFQIGVSGPELRGRRLGKWIAREFAQRLHRLG